MTDTALARFRHNGVVRSIALYPGLSHEEFGTLLTTVFGVPQTLGAPIGFISDVRFSCRRIAGI